MEKEADYIGLLLVASAGYDPRVAPTVLEKFIDRDSMLTDYRSTQHRPHISKAEAEAKYKAVLHEHAEEKKRAELLFQAQVRKRAESLAKAQVMDEALTIYENVGA
jgi:predicted Zn-dependent protease